MALVTPNWEESGGVALVTPNCRRVVGWPWSHLTGRRMVGRAKIRYTRRRIMAGRAKSRNTRGRRMVEVLRVVISVPSNSLVARLKGIPSLVHNHTG